MQLFGLEKLSLVDYDGKVACTVFTGTCNFKCGFCHNSPLVTEVNQLQEIDVESVFSYLKKRKGIIEGICISGGEPTLQKDLPDFCRRLKEENLSVKLDTNGTNPDMIKLLMDNNLIDYIAMDIKNSLDSYSEIIGLKNFDTTKIAKSVSLIMNGNVGYEFRTTLISEYHFEKQIEDIGKWIKGAKKYCLQQYKHTENCICHDLSAVPVEKAKEFVKILSPYLDNVILRGY
ncbi:MAG: anaerobic ribonucleoside-triphosphate reductase activating protein [Clostridiales bacterium]|nr:anaerobic ribonucleoside-triphosphate reductase activating protein [Clostridiales bacterium]